MAVRWGIIGTGDVAAQMAEALQYIGSPITAVASRRVEKAQAFAARFGIETFTHSYDEVCGHPNVDAVYIALPHTLHNPVTRCALIQGKHVLCEKPIAVNAPQAKEMFELARKQGLMLMEAIWTRFIPLLGEIIELIKSGRLGAVRLLKADFAIDEGMRFESHRLLDPQLAGGALLDTGVYPLTMAAMLFSGCPEILWSQAGLSGGVDMDNFTILGYPEGQRAILYSGISGTLPEEALIVCENGYIRLPNFFYCQKAVVCCDHSLETLERPFLCNGYEYELRHFEQCVASGLSESPVMTHRRSIEMMTLLDELRCMWGLAYPCEKEAMG